MARSDGWAAGFMAEDPEDDPSLQESELSLDRCPKCGGKMKLLKNLAESLCTSCGIFIEVVRPVAEEPVKSEDALDLESRRRLALFHLRLEEMLDGDENEARAEVSAEGHRDVPERPRTPAPVAREVEPIREESIPRDEASLDFEPAEGATEPAEPATFRKVQAEPAWADDEVPYEGAPSRKAPSRTPLSAAALRRGRKFYYVGVGSSLIGGSGLLLGSILHDLFRVPLFGQGYGVVGPLNATALMAGGVLLLAGVASMAVGLRGGVVRAKVSGG